MRILVVEDDPDLSRQLKAALDDAGYAVDHAPDGEEAHFLGETEPYDAIVLDLGLPKIDGVSVLERWRRANVATPVLILTARGAWSEKVAGFDAGADDYLTKPFALAELTIRVQALLRRGPMIQENVLKVDNLELNRLTRQVRRGGKRIELSPKEYSLLEYLFLHTGRTLSRSMIVERIWDQSFEGLTNIVDVYVGHLRHKIDEGFDTKLIRTVRGLGYSLDPHTKS